MKYLKDIKDWQELKNQVVVGDCLEGMKLLPDKCIDLILTDPPYGIGIVKSGKIGNPKGACETWAGRKQKTFKKSSWDDKIPSKEIFDLIMNTSKNQVIWGGNYFVEHLKNSPCWLVWDKKDHSTTFSDCELAWTSFKTAVRYYGHLWSGYKQERMGRNAEKKVHPTQKPVELMRWILENYSKEGDLICDPFMGSWTTARACKDLGRDFIGFELSEEYCKIGEERLRQEVLF